MIGYSETTIRPESLYSARELAWRVPAGHCQSCATKLPVDNSSVCEGHRGDTCNSCDASISHRR